MTFFEDYVRLQQVYFPDIGVSEVIDITIMTVLIYYVVTWIRKTHAWALLKGILTFAFIALIANILDLVTVIWMVQNAFAMGLIALVILFQPELRKALEKLGRGVELGIGNIGTSDVKNARLTTETIEEIAAAVEIMASKRTGALICIEDNVNLDDLIATGIKVDGLVTKQLIINIFENRTPLHDGAIVVRRDRIMAATCILPLTAEEIDPALGTRHRAGLGASEISDAVIIVVSEETGQVSAAISGEFKRPLTTTELKELLASGREVETRRRFLPWKRQPKAAGKSGEG